MESAIQIAIYVHAFLGGIGLITGLGSVFVQKGSKLHTNMGKLFSVGMLGSSLISMPIATLPNHKNLFLFLIALFTIYLVLVGNRAVTFKTKEKANTIDYLLSGAMFVCSLMMLVFGIFGMLQEVSMSVLYVVFGGFGLLLTVRDFMFYKNFKQKKISWLVAHLSKMIGALIASITAFIVAGVGSTNLIAWLLPSVLGTAYIIYYKRKVLKA